MNKLITIIFVLTIATSVAFPLRAISQTTNREEYEQSRNEMIEDMKRRSAEDARLTLKMEPVVVFLIFVLFASGACFFLMSKSRTHNKRFETGKGNSYQIKKVEKPIHKTKEKTGTKKYSGVPPPAKTEDKETNEYESDGTLKTLEVDSEVEKIRVRVKYGTTSNINDDGHDRKLKKVRTRKRKSK